jgi:elongation factor G
MPPRPRLTDIRNIGIAAHIDAGKTTVTERVLYYAGRTHKMGEVHDGKAVMDYMPQEQERGITITAAVTSVPWQGREIHIIDTPGHVDFTVEVERSMRVLDGLVVVVGALSGVEPQTETVWHQADRYGVARLCFVNKLDRPGADFDRTVGDVARKLESRPLPLQHPLFEKDVFTGVVDLLHRRTLTWSADDEGRTVHEAEVPASLAELVETRRDQLVASLADRDDALAEKYLDGTDITIDELKAAIRRQTIARQVVPVLAGAALRNRGIQPLLDAVVDYLPSPKDLPPVTGTGPRGQGDREERAPDPNAPFSALAFKVRMEEGRKVVYFRVYSGRVREGDDVFNATRIKSDRVARLVAMHADRKERIEEARAGDIVAGMGMKVTSTGDTLCTSDAPLLLEPPIFQEPVISLAVEPRATRELDKLKSVLEKMIEEDPTLRVREDAESGQTLLSGMGELHLDVVLDRMRREYAMEVNTGRPAAVCRETLGRAAEATFAFDRVLGGEDEAEKPLYAEVSVRVGPRARGAGNDVRVAPEVLVEAALAAALVEGARQALQSGPAGGWPVDDVELVVTAIARRPGATTPQAAHIAAAGATRKALEGGEPRLLVPTMRIEVVTPDESVGEVIGDLQARGGRVDHVEREGVRTVVRALVPLPRMFGYSTDVRSLTQGRATFSMTFSHYDTP